MSRMSDEELFLTKEQLARLTGRKWRTKQVEQLRRMGLPFYINAGGEPIVTCAAVEGRPETNQPSRKRWQPLPAPSHASHSSRPHRYGEQ